MPPLYLLDGLLLQKGSALAGSKSCCCKECKVTGVTLNSASGGVVGTGLYVTANQCTIEMSSSGTANFRCCLTPPRDLIISAPTQIRLLIGGTIISSGRNYSGTPSISGEVGFQVADSYYKDNQGSFSVFVTVCCPPGVNT